MKKEIEMIPVSYASSASSANKSPQSINLLSSRINKELADTNFKNHSSTVWFTTIQAANYLDISAQALQNMVSAGKMPYYKLGRRNRFKKTI